MNGQSSIQEQRAKQACEPCRKKKTKCPGEKPTCSFCRRLNQRCVYLSKDRTSSTFKHKNDSKERLHRLEAQVEKLQGTIQTLAGSRSDMTASDVQISQNRGQSMSRPLPSQRIGLVPRPFCFHIETCPHPPFEELPYFVEIYRSHVHSQPLPLFDLGLLLDHLTRSPPFLLSSFLAITLLFTEHPFYDSSKSDAVDFYIHSAREAVIPLAAEGAGTTELLQSLCLLTLSDIAAGEQARAVMNICIGARLSKHLNESLKISPIAEDKLRCCWSIFMLEKVFSPGPSILQIDAPPFVNMRLPSSPSMPPSPNNPEVLNTTLSPPYDMSKDLGIVGYCIQLTSIWGDIAEYMRQIRLGQVEDPWLASSTYHKLTAEFYKFESTMAQVHRFKNVSFHTRSRMEIYQHMNYFTSWILLQTTFHTGHTLLNHPLFHITNPKSTSRSFRPPTFLQHVVDEALLHSGWTVRLIRTAEELGHEINDPFIVYQVISTATVHWIFSFASDDAIAERACSDFDRCRQFVGRMVGNWPQFSRAVQGLDYLRGLIDRTDRNMNGNGIPAFKVSVLWDLLHPDPVSPRRSRDTSPQLLNPAGERVSTQYLTHLRDSSEPQCPNYTRNPLIGTDQIDPAPSFHIEDPFLDEELLSSLDIPVSPQLHCLSFGGL